MGRRDEQWIRLGDEDELLDSARTEGTEADRDGDQPGPPPSDQPDSADGETEGREEHPDSRLGEGALGAAGELRRVFQPHRVVAVGALLGMVALAFAATQLAASDPPSPKSASVPAQTT